ncbi:MAG: hypothetical protein DME17_03060 [Candidatus Rokuibacteriota bacterium]|nr:MAG: hypothetical protein DME17_03060 [Candidatus Rokubacteria bacterium]PYN15405.1 MAG: hypothetical protein DME06_03230 [Candidatus Rokubacteria bacterium]
MAELTRRYIVMAMATEAPFDLTDVEGVFVLKPWKDPAALRALETYRDNCYPELARELDAWIAMARAGTRVLGGVGRRNEQFVRPAGPSAKGAARSAPKPRASAGRKKRKPAGRKR